MVRYLLRPVKTVPGISFVFYDWDLVGGRNVTIKTCVPRFAASRSALCFTFVAGSVHTEATNDLSGNFVRHHLLKLLLKL